ncbi:uncharacterized protein TNIN_185651 [Trichonephila inaurata madagascariensis]|uniref:RIIa domain-containing protein n=1 Tax=Trichonephila inaurata madagascariensis TaxID=2747483 RepID=A0A8X6JBF6_9ARAC|nr:uncharacterized protein TNIN_185651 [Trichonephila inaurata madagascariensis]
MNKKGSEAFGVPYNDKNNECSAQLQSDPTCSRESRVVATPLEKSICAVFNLQNKTVGGENTLTAVADEMSVNLENSNVCHPLCSKIYSEHLYFLNADMLLATVLTKSFFAIVTERPHDPLQFVIDALQKKQNYFLQNEKSEASTSTEPRGTSSSLVAVSNGVASEAGNSVESILDIPNSYRGSYYSVNADMLLADMLSKALTIIISESQHDSIQFVIDVLENAKERYLVVDDSNGYLRNNGTADPNGESQPKKRKIKKTVTWAPPDELVKTVYIPKVKNTRKYIPTRKNKGKNKENRRRVLLRGFTSRMQSWESSSSCVYDGSFDLDDTLMEFISDALYAALKERPHDPIKFVAEYLFHTYNFT